MPVIGHKYETEKAALRTQNLNLNESTPVLQKDGKTIYFTRNNYLKEKRQKTCTFTLIKYTKQLINNSGLMS
jgi:hypothetical protein